MRAVCVLLCGSVHTARVLVRQRGGWRMFPFLGNRLNASSGFQSMVGGEVGPGLNSALFCSGTVQVRTRLQLCFEEGVYE